MISAVVLAAGASTRLGRPKQLLDLGGKPVLQHVVDAALASDVDEVIVVLGHAAREVAEAVPPRGRARFAVNRRYALGQSTSLLAGLRAANAASKAAVMLLGDQPRMTPEAIRAVVAAWNEDRGLPVVQAAYTGRPGHPTLFARSIWPALQDVHGDQGAREVLARHPEWRRLVEVGGDPPADIDTEEDYRRVREVFGTSHPA